MVIHYRIASWKVIVITEVAWIKVRVMSKQSKLKISNGTNSITKKKLKNCL